MKAAALIVGLGLASAVFAASTAFATEPAPEPARVVFANGGRVLSIAADGSDRKVLVGKSRNPKNEQAGASNPEVSPDGDRLSFSWVRTRDAGEFSDIWLANGDGTGARRILKGDRNNFYADPTFTPSGDLVVAYFRRSGKRAEAGLARVGNSGKFLKKILVIRQRRRPFSEWTYVRDARFSPDGSKILYGTTEGAFPDAAWSRLSILNRKTGKSRLLAKKALDGAWSPDGGRIVYTSLTWNEDIEVCGLEAPVCNDAGRLRIINADGSGSRSLVSTGGDQRGPDWSGDGRIVFQSAGNVPNAAEAYETFSVKPDGGCLTMLTDGTPASLNPSWVDPPGEAGKASTDPGKCGGRPELTLDVRKPTLKGALADMFWAGARADTRLYTGIFREGRAPYLSYLDCSAQRETGCPKPFYIVQASLCAAAGHLPATVGGKPDRIQRGLPVYTYTAAEAGPIAYLLAGRFEVVILGGSKGGVKEVDALRRLSEAKAEGDLPVPRFPAGDIHRMNKVRELFKATGSVRKVANRMGLSVRVVRQYLRLSRSIKRYGDYKTQKCPVRASSSLLSGRG